MGVRESVGQGIDEAFQRHSKHHQELIAAQLNRDEKLIAFQEGETKAPFLIRILPLIGDLFGRAKIYLLAITDRRILILQLSKSITKGRQLKEVTASIPYSELEEIEPSTGSLTSSITIRTKSGKAYSFVNMLKSAAEAFARDATRAAKR